MPRTVLAFVAHPDDETYAAAGLLSLAVRKGCRVVVVAATRGEGGVDRTRSHAPNGLGAVRSHELGQACRIIGAADPHFLGLHDGAVTAPAAAKALAPRLSEIGPDLIVTLGEDGAYGHPDHLACTAALKSLEPLAPVLHAVFPKGLFSPVATALSDLVTLSPYRLGTDPEGVDLRLELDQELSALKREALAAHKSQLDDGDPRTFLRLGLIDPLLREEWFRLASGALPLPYPAFEAWLGE